MSEDPGSRTDAVTPATRGAKRGVASVFAILVILAVAAYIGWRFFYYPTTPQYALDRFFEAAKAKDYDRVYDLVQVPGPLRALVRNGQELKELADRFPAAVPQVDTYRFGRSEITEDHARIDVTMVTLQNGRRSLDVTPFELTRTGGIWRIDGQWILNEVARRGLGGFLLGAP